MVRNSPSAWLILRIDRGSQVRSIAMNIENAVKLINWMPDSWARMEQFRRIPGGFEVSFRIHKGQRGKRVAGWNVTCRKTHEAKITEMDGGGLRVYSSSHPAARQYAARRAELRWPLTCNKAEALVALYQAHSKVADDWIPFDQYLFLDRAWDGSPLLIESGPVPGKNFVCRGPEFLLRAYARALAAIGEEVKLALKGAAKPKAIRPKVLHFGGSYIVADVFSAERQGEAR